MPKKKLILSKSDPLLENLVESVLTELTDDENDIVDNIFRQYFAKNGAIEYIIKINLKMPAFNVKKISKGNDIDNVIGELELLSNLFKHFKRICRKIEADGYTSNIEFGEDTVVICIDTKEAEFAKTIKIKPELTLRNIKMKNVSYYTNGATIRLLEPECEEHYIIDCLGAIPQEAYTELSDAIKSPIEEVKIVVGQLGEVYNRSRIKLIGWETPMPVKDYDLYYLKGDCFKVTVQDIKTKEKYKMYGYLFKETEKEFKRRLVEYAEKAIDIIDKTNNYSKQAWIPFTIGSHFIEVEYAMHEAQEILFKRDSMKKGECDIVEKCETHIFNEQQLKNKRQMAW